MDVNENTSSANRVEDIMRAIWLDRKTRTWQRGANDKRSYRGGERGRGIAIVGGAVVSIVVARVQRSAC